ncbi:class I SAM-dependent methyltransferase [Thalassococcus sp. CAU 1522]|uniref:Class I SAM-dependent methyltransferase n=1 Tax=Thalassococcus arenae TaxID=2851652 RepID=A0ABS6N4N4_9RHOB|nr:class I SAM-dependent methyltransferase [Thalassococcus arenae]MBV2358977.1 class I SAM-dependent methyltransferase [Thalassococcus arenae]
MTTKAAFWDKIAEGYAKRPVGDAQAYEQTLNRVRHWLAPDMAVLELGCGTGTTALRLADTGADILGTDLSGEMIRIAEGKAAVQGDANVRFAVAEAGAAQGAFDAVMAFNLLHLVEDLPGTLTHVRARLPEGGLFISKTPCLGGKPWFRPLIGLLRLVGKAPFVAFLRPAELRRAIEAAGFEVVETGDYPPKLPSHFVVARAV